MNTQEEPQSPTTPIAASADDAPSVHSEGSGIASLDKVRDILFGSQMRELESRFDKLESRLVKEANDVRDDVTRRIEALERRATALADQVAASQRDHRQNQVDTQRQIADEIRQQVDHALLTLAREVQELRTDKADRAALATLFTAMARRLTAEANTPGSEGPSSG